MQSSLMHLPPELLFLIMEQLSRGDLFACSLVSRQWRSVAAHRLFRFLTIPGSQDSRTVSDIVQSIWDIDTTPSLGAHVRAVYISGFDMDLAVLNFLMDHLPRLTMLDISGTTLRVGNSSGPQSPLNRHALKRVNCESFYVDNNNYDQIIGFLSLFSRIGFLEIDDDPYAGNDPWVARQHADTAADSCEQAALQIDNIHLGYNYRITCFVVPFLCLTGSFRHLTSLDMPVEDPLHELASLHQLLYCASATLKILRVEMLHNASWFTPEAATLGKEFLTNIAYQAHHLQLGHSSGKVASRAHSMHGARGALPQRRTHSSH